MDTIETELIGEGSKHDERGRRIVSAAERERLLLAYETSGLTQKEFARREGVKFATFTTWLGRWRRARALAGPPPPVGFEEVVLGGGGATVGLGLEVRLSDGVVVRGRGVREVAELVRALRA